MDMANTHQPTGLFRAVEIIDALLLEIHQGREALAISPARRQAYRVNRAGEDADCRHDDSLALEAQALERARQIILEAGHNDVTQPALPIFEVKFGRDDD